jgi:hypothetical protein
MAALARGLRIARSRRLVNCVAGDVGVRECVQFVPVDRLALLADRHHAHVWAHRGVEHAAAHAQVVVRAADADVAQQLFALPALRVPLLEKIPMLALQHFQPIGGAIDQYAQRGRVWLLEPFVAAAPAVVAAQSFGLGHRVTPRHT